jgi:D-tyrosyl-tRNA(Tyr) deacylase
MRAVIQRVSASSVTVDNKMISQTGDGLLILLGVARGDTAAEADFLAEKTANLRIFKDENEKMNRSMLDAGGEAMVVSNFTLCADCRNGRRPSFTNAADAKNAQALYERYAAALQKAGVKTVRTGRFGAMMAIDAAAQGPVTIILDTDEIMPK